MLTQPRPVRVPQVMPPHVGTTDLAPNPFPRLAAVGHAEHQGHGVLAEPGPKQRARMHIQIEAPLPVAFVAKLKSIAARTDAAIACIHHTGKEVSRGMRGSAALLGNADFVLEIGEDDSIGIAKCREGKAGTLSNFALEQVVLGTDEDGDVATSCVVRFTHATAEAKKRKAPLPANPKRALDLLQRFYSEDKAQEVDPSLIGLDDISPNKRPLVVPIEAWKELCATARLVPDGKPSSERQTFDRAVKALDAANEIGRFGAYVWVLGQKRNVPKWPIQSSAIVTCHTLSQRVTL